MPHSGLTALMIEVTPRLEGIGTDQKTPSSSQLPWGPTVPTKPQCLGRSRAGSQQRRLGPREGKGWDGAGPAEAWAVGTVPGSYRHRISGRASLGRIRDSSRQVMGQASRTGRACSEHEHTQVTQSLPEQKGGSQTMPVRCQGGQA